MKIINYLPLIAGIWASLNGLLHNIAVWRNHKGEYDRDLLRLLMDGLILWIVGTTFLFCFWQIKKGQNDNWYLIAITSLSLITYSIMILPFFKSKAFIAICIFLLLTSIFAIFKTINLKNNKINMIKIEVLTKYFESWNEKNETIRHELLQNSFSEAGNYLDPHIPKPVESRNAMNEIIRTFQSRLPHKLTQNSEPEFHNSIFRIQWKMENNGNILSYGTFVGEFDEDNKICRVFCFIDKFIGVSEK
jgi:uncharacterized membrane protein HdeD (DUF308 family)